VMGRRRSELLDSHVLRMTMCSILASRDFMAAEWEKGVKFWGIF
jgi:hypothetical protein